MRERLFGELLPATVEHGSWAGELTILSGEGVEIPVSQVIIAHYASDGRPEYFSTVLRDMRERKRAEEELRQAQKMEALGRLAGGLSHDFNNLLTVILGECDLLLGDLAPDDPSYPSVEQIRQSGARAAALIRQLLAFSRRQMLQPELIDLNQVIAGMEQMLRRLIGEDIALMIVLASDLPTVRADAGQIEQVVMNLVINARDAMPEGGQLLIETLPVLIGWGPGGPPIELTPGLYALISVADTGVGIDEAARVHIFEPFFTTKPRGKGTGLGLATVHGIVQQSGGSIWFHSESGAGSTFKVYLPAVAGPVAEPQRGAGQAPKRLAAETVLLVEDEESVRALARTILMRAGFTVLEAADGRAAVELVRGHTGELHALLTDVVMPGGLNGVQVAAAVRNLRPTIRVVYMSGYTDNALVGRGLEDVEAGFIQKPFTAAALVDALAEALAR
jgi:signal transduction histidine kinase/ActR/RegA family two-component response regulator